MTRTPRLVVATATLLSVPTDGEAGAVHVPAPSASRLATTSARPSPPLDLAARVGRLHEAPATTAPDRAAVRGDHAGLDARRRSKTSAHIPKRPGDPTGEPFQALQSLSTP